MDTIPYMPPTDNTTFILCMMVLTIVIGLAGLNLVWKILWDHSAR
jgi:hypothetical protein